LLISGTAASGSGLAYPAEWATHRAVWLGFRTYGEGFTHEAILKEMIAALAPHAPVKLVVEDPELFPEGDPYFTALGVDPGRVEVVYLSPADFWFRDPGPLFLVDGDGGTAVADFQFTDYANVDPALASPKALGLGGIDRSVASRLDLPVRESILTLEGGAFEVNGRGTILLSRRTEERNPHLSRPQIEAEIRRTLGQRNLIWLGRGLAQDPPGFSRITGRYWGWGTGGARGRVRTLRRRADRPAPVGSRGGARPHSFASPEPPPNG
jgi:agmatine deiminase